MWIRREPGDQLALNSDSTESGHEGGRVVLAFPGGQGRGEIGFCRSHGSEGLGICMLGSSVVIARRAPDGCVHLSS
jgi:hypothetical protein